MPVWQSTPDKPWLMRGGLQPRSGCTIDSSPVSDCFPDPNLALAMAQALHGNTNLAQTLTTADTNRTVPLRLSNKGIGNVEGLRYFTKVTELYLDHNHITDISPLLRLQNNDTLALTKLDLGSNQLDNNGLDDIEWLFRLPKLQYVWLDNNHITDLGCINSLDQSTGRVLRSLKYLDASGQTVTLPDLETDFNQSFTMGPASLRTLGGARIYALPSSGTSPNTINGGIARGTIPPAPSPTTNAGYTRNQRGDYHVWATDGAVGFDHSVPDPGTMWWPRRGPGIYTFGFRAQGNTVATFGGGADSLIFSGTITQKVTYNKNGCNVDASSIRDCFHNSDGDTLAYAVAKALGRPVDSPLTLQDLTRTSLDLSSSHIKDLTHIDLFWCLQNLNLRDNQISDISPLSVFSDALTSLDLGSNQLYNNSLTPLVNNIDDKPFWHLQSLWLDHNHLTDLTPLGDMGYGGAGAKLLSLRHLDASGQSVTMPDLPVDLTQPVTLGPAKIQVSSYTLFAQPSSGSGTTTILNTTSGGYVPAREAAAPPAPSPTTDARWHDGTSGGATTWGKDGSYWVFGTPAADDGTMTWPRRGAGTYTYGFRMQGPNNCPNNSTTSNGPYGNYACGGSTPAGGAGSMVLSGTITQRVYRYDVTFDPQNGSSPWTEHVYGDYATRPVNNPILDHHTFDDWWTTPRSGGTKWDFTNTKLTTSITLYARWVPIRHTVTIDQNGGHGAPTSLTVNEGQPIGTLTTSKEGHHLTGWTD
ncbi:hypothetical protein CRD60_08130, partial [Bifidobacterium aemilianum]